MAHGLDLALEAVLSGCGSQIGSVRHCGMC